MTIEIGGAGEFGEAIGGVSGDEEDAVMDESESLREQAPSRTSSPISAIRSLRSSCTFLLHVFVQELDHGRIRHQAIGAFDQTMPFVLERHQLHG